MEIGHNLISDITDGAIGNVVAACVHQEAAINFVVPKTMAALL